MIKLSRVMPRCVRFISSPPVDGVLRSRNPVADPRRVEIVLAQVRDAVAVQPDQEGLAPDVLFGQVLPEPAVVASITIVAHRSEEHTSELQSLMRISYAVFCLK